MAQEQRRGVQEAEASKLLTKIILEEIASTRFLTEIATCQRRVSGGISMINSQVVANGGMPSNESTVNTRLLNIQPVLNE